MIKEEEIMATFQLVMQSGPTKGTTYPLEKPEIFIGRDLGNDLVINDVEVSRRHVRIFLQGAGYVIEDQGSTNGTSVSGQKLMGPYTLRAGDLITFGEHINILVEAIQVDSEATMVSGKTFAETMLPPKAPQPAPYVAPQPIPSAPQYVPPPPPPSSSPYAGQVPMQPEEEVKKKKLPIWLIIILIAIILLICICAVISYFMPESWWCTLLGWLLNMFTPGVCP
jgi:pSer/pThr/pTyr-binding forkhead associated (FHA) protein